MGGVNQVASLKQQAIFTFSIKSQLDVKVWVIELRGSPALILLGLRIEAVTDIDGFRRHYISVNCHLASFFDFIFGLLNLSLKIIHLELSIFTSVPAPDLASFDLIGDAMDRFFLLMVSIHA